MDIKQDCMEEGNDESPVVKTDIKLECDTEPNDNTQKCSTAASFTKTAIKVENKDEANGNVLLCSKDSTAPEIAIKQENAEEEEKHDLYSYTKLNDFTSEIYKIEISGFPKIFGYNQLRKLLNSTLQVNARKVKTIGKPPHFAFVTFKDEEDRDAALKKLNGYVWRGKTLSAKKANPAADPMAQKRKAGDSEDSRDSKRSKEEDMPIELRLKTAVTPYWNVPYEEQLKLKEDAVHKFLMQLSKVIGNVNKDFRDILSKNRKENHHQCCPLIPIKPSPVTTAYRNKCEFTVGRHLHTKEKTVGFRLNSYKQGSMSVAEPDDCINISSEMLQAVKSFEKYVRESELDVYNPETHGGYWRQLTVRTSTNADILLIVVMHPQSLSEEQLEKEKMKLKEYYKTGSGSSCGITSIYFQLFTKKSTHEESDGLTHLMGKQFLEESLLGMKFQVSPEAFFQINIPATEILYSMVADFAKASSPATVLDICCGTGTISLCLAKAGFKVIGIEMCSEAVENARINAQLNNLSEVEFICGKAEDVIYTAIDKCNSSEIVAVVDPPRAGLHQRVIKVIRATSKIQKLIYVSCNAAAAMTNFIDLCRPKSNNFKESPFYPVQAAAVDLFPYTPHKELILIFERSVKEQQHCVEKCNDGSPVVGTAMELECDREPNNNTKQCPSEASFSKSVIKVENNDEANEIVPLCSNDSAAPKKAIKPENSEEVQKHDLYSYTKSNDFTSKIYKLEISAFPTFFGWRRFRNLLKSTLKLNHQNMKFTGKFALVKFKNEEDRDIALNKLNGYVWKGKTLSAKKVDLAADPMAQKRKAGDSEDSRDSKRSKDEDIPIDIRFKIDVTPYWKVPYEKQLLIKEDEIRKFLTKLKKGIGRNNKDFRKILRRCNKKLHGQCCPLIQIKPSPITTAYSNKYEFAVGRHPHTEEKTVGFHLKSYTKGAVSVAEPDDCINISSEMLQAVKSFEKYVRESELSVYKPKTGKGHWRQLTVRTSNNADILLVVAVCRQTLSEERLEKEKMKLKEYYETGNGSSCGITSVYLKLFFKKSSPEENTRTKSLTHLIGKQFLEKSLLGMKFQVSPEAFFRVNIPASEILYTMVTDFAMVSSPATVLDICCGIGTISLGLAKAGLKVIGIEKCSDAVENARRNARLNNLPDVEFICGKAEDVILTAIDECNSSEILAVVDPPRKLHHSVIKVIRATPKIQRLIYVSCDVYAAMVNFIDLCRPMSNKFEGCPFYPIQAAVVDLLPYTRHKELILIFERYDNNVKKNIV